MTAYSVTHLVTYLYHCIFPMTKSVTVPVPVMLLIVLLLPVAWASFVVPRQRSDDIGNTRELDFADAQTPDTNFADANTFAASPQDLHSDDNFPSLSDTQLQDLVDERCTRTPGPIANTAIQMQGALSLNYVFELGTGLQRTVGQVQISIDARPLKAGGYISSRHVRHPASKGITLGYSSATLVGP